MRIYIRVDGLLLLALLAMAVYLFSKSRRTDLAIAECEMRISKLESDRERPSKVKALAREIGEWISILKQPFF